MSIFNKHKYNKEYLNKERYIVYVESLDTDIHNIKANLYIKLRGEETKVFDYENSRLDIKAYQIHMLDLGTDGELVLDIETNNKEPIGKIKVTFENKDGIFFSETTDIRSNTVKKLILVETGVIRSTGRGQRYYKLKMLKG